jgi:fructose-1,6-bisphosphatase/inositol monophosphatase family enzyme
MPVIDGAGGVITVWSGQPLSLESQGRVVAAATPQLHRQAMRVLGAAMT